MTTHGRIIPGTVFLDTDGNVAQLHGVGIQKIVERFFAWGEDKTIGDRFSAVACYSSTDLATWTFEGNSLETGEGDLAADRIVERPKVLAHPDGRYVMLLHIESADYSDAKVGFAVSDNPVGPYSYLGSEQPFGNASRDIGVYQEDGVGYLLSEDREHGLHIYRLSADYLSIDAVVATTLKNDGSHGYESPALIKHDGLYYLFGSDLTGWNLNDNKYSTAAHLEGPWAPWRDFAPVGTATFGSQVSTIVPVTTKDGAGYVYVGDRWQRGDLSTSPAVWLPLTVGGGEARLLWRDEWDITELAA